jgi:predicted dehydrogenase
MIGVAILGSGFMARTHAAAWAEHADRAEVRVVASRTLEGAAKVAETCGAEVSDDLLATMARDDIQVVDICLPTPLHRPMAEAAFAAGCDVLLEKPIALSIEDAEAIIAARDASGRKLLLGFVLRFWAEYEELVRQVASGTIGTPQVVSTLRLSAPPDWNEWMFDPDISGGVAVDFLIHDIDQINLLLTDFKGGSTFLGMEKLPHTAAVVTNMAEEAELVSRMGEVLTGELDRRQAILRQAGIQVGAAGALSGVAEYEKYREGGADLAPLPTLFVVVDEFAELLQSHPDFLALFDRICRVGR